MRRNARIARRGQRRRASVTVLVAVVVALGAAWMPLSDSAVHAAPTGLRVEAESPRAGYDRDLFEHWTDADGDGCDTRDEVLIAESITAVQVSQPGCQLSGGRWVSIYDGVETIDSSSFDVDHVVPLAEAWDSGAWAWDAARREAFANDLARPDALFAVSASSNRAKGDRDPAEWQPDQDSVSCRYAQAWVEVKVEWNLSADPAEAAALDAMLVGCDGQLPVGGTFSDDNGQVHEPMIEAIAAAGITGGCTAAGDRYCPRNSVTRGQMAAFLARVLELPAAATDHFADDGGSTHEDAINRVADAGIAGGTDPNTYQPSGDVTRAQMATFLARATDLTQVSSGPFTDVAGNTHEGNINAIDQADITSGCNPQGTRYCPSEPVTRAQMASFLGRAFGLTPIMPPAAPTTTVTTTTAPSNVPPNPGDVRNCGDFATWPEAQAWFDTYAPHYGDVAGLDADGDGVACESLPGAP